MPAPRPITFLSDYGATDEFAGVCRAVIARIAPDAQVIDLTHGIPRHDVARGARGAVQDALDDLRVVLRIATLQRSRRRFGQADVGGKPGVGLVLELGEAAKVTAVNLRAGEGLTVEIYTSDQSGTTLEDWGPPVGTGESLGPDATIAVTDPNPSRTVLVWLTVLPSDGEGSFVGRIAEVSVRGIPT